MKAPPPDPRMSTLFGWCLILFLALPMGGGAAWHVASKSGATAWPKTSAAIMSSEAYRTIKPALWCIKMKYRYQVEGRSYTSARTSSSQVAGAGCDRDRRVIAARLERMRPGELITVRYDRDNPGSAVVYLAPVLEFIDGFFGLVGIVWLALGIRLIREGRRLRRGQDAARAARPKPAFR